MAERPGGARRLAVGGGTWRPALVPMLAIAVVVGAAAFAARGPSAATEPHGLENVTLSRTLSCVADAPGSSTRLGTIPTSTNGVRIAQGRGVFTPTLASAGYGVQWLRGKSAATPWLAARSCPSVGDDWWFVGVGPTTQHASVLTLDNPYAVDATATITAYGAGGPIPIPGASSFSVQAGTHHSWKVADIAADPTHPTSDITVHVTVTRGLVAASVWDDWAQSVTSPTVKQWVPAAPVPGKRVQLMTRPGAMASGTRLYVTNPSDNTAFVHLTGVNKEATFAPVKHASFSVEAGSTATIPVDDLGKVAFSSLILTADQTITAGLRQVHSGAEEYAVPALPIGAQSTVGLPGGTTTVLSLDADRAADVTVLAIDAHGKTVLKKTVSVAAERAAAIAVPSSAVALRLNTTADAGVSATVALSGGGYALLSLVPTANAAAVPRVEPLPY